MREAGSRSGIALAWAAATAVSISIGSSAAAKPTIKEQMGENFAGLQTILVALIMSNYASVPGQAAILRDHAVQLTETIPPSAQSERDRFLGLALALKSHAESLGSISEALARQDKEKLTRSEDLDVNVLRESLATHYGAMVVTCVSCHNQFRRQQLAK
jgi:hypothetical protein